MALDLYYFISTLPALSLNQPPLWSYDEFMARCAEALTPGDYDKIAAIRLDVQRTLPAGLPQVVYSWQSFETLLRNTIAELRAARLHRPAPVSRETSAFDMFAQNAVREAFKAPSPAEREAAINALRWQYAEELQAQKSFSLDALAVYALKLQILQRNASRSLETGLPAYQSLVEDGVNQAIARRIER